MIFQVKKLSALILSFILCFNLCVPAFAAETDLPEENEPLILQGAAIAASIVQATTATANLVVQTVTQAPSLFIDLLDEFCTFDEDVQALYGSGRRFAQAISEASSFSDVGDIIIEGVMNGKIYRFIQWLREEKGLIPGGNSVQISFGISDLSFSDGLTVKPYFVANAVQSQTFIPVSDARSLTIFRLGSGGTFADGRTWRGTGSYLEMYAPDGTLLKSLAWSVGVNTTVVFIYTPGKGLCFAMTEQSILDSNNPWLVPLVDTSPSLNSFFGVSEESFAFTPKLEFQELPSEIPDNQGLTIDTNISDLDTSDPQATADTIFQFIIDGNYIPVVSVGDVPVTYDPQITASQFSVTSTTFNSSISLTGLDPSHEYKPFWALYNKTDLTQVIASGYAAEIGTVTGVGSFSGYSQVTNLTPATAYLINWTLLDSTANEIVPSVSNVEFTTSSGASSDDSPSILLMILNKVSEILDKMNGGQSEGILASINDKLDDLIDTVANQYERELGDNFKDSLSGVNESFFSETGKGQGVTVSNVVDLADTQSVFKGIFSGDYGFSDFLGLFSDEGFFPWFSSDTAMDLNPTVYGSPSAADLDDPYNMQSYYDNVEKVRNKSDD